MSRLDQLNTSPKDVIQMYKPTYDAEGEFANPDSPAAKDLKVIINNLDRDAEKILKKYNKYTNTTLLFATGSVYNNNLGKTIVEAKIGEIWYSLRTVDPKDLLELKICPDTPIRIRVIVNLDVHGTLDGQNGDVLATLTHEITAHVIQYEEWIHMLRSGKYTEKQICEAWRSYNEPGKMLDIVTQHNRLAEGKNRSFTNTAKNVYVNAPEE